LISTLCLESLNLVTGTDLVRTRERSAGMQGNDETWEAEVARWIGCLKPDGKSRDLFLGFRFPASPQLRTSGCGDIIVEVKYLLSHRYLRYSLE
jgi:hypothetical protein